MTDSMGPARSRIPSRQRNPAPTLPKLPPPPPAEAPLPDGLADVLINPAIEEHIASCARCRALWQGGE